jgi:hypothetical protein
MPSLPKCLVVVAENVRFCSDNLNLAWPQYQNCQQFALTMSVTSTVEGFFVNVELS